MDENMDDLITEDQDSELIAAKELNDLYANKIKQQAAEFENYRNRTSKEMGQVYDKGVREVVLALLPIIDNFALATKNADKADGFAAGMLMIQNQLHGMLEHLGIEKIPTIGEKFDTKYHSAVSHITDENSGENMIVQELQGGYIHKDNVIRHAMVVVAN